MILYINSVGFDMVEFGLIPEQGEKKALRQKSFAIDKRNADHVLIYLKRFLGPKPTTLAITKIYVVSGPGSFTGIRTGVSVALALGFGWNIPVYGIAKSIVPNDLKSLTAMKLKKITPAFIPEYGAEPNITIAKQDK